MDETQFLTHTLRRHPRGPDVTRILSSALAAVEPGAAVARSLNSDSHTLTAGGEAISLDGVERIYLLGAGKAVAPMARATAAILPRPVTAGVIVTRYGHATAGLPPSIELVEAGHPIPDRNGMEGTHRIMSLLEDAGENDLVLCLISGGGSALLVSPAPGFTLEALGDLTAQLLASGADIHEINTVRKHLSQVKGGQLARLAHPAQVITLILSDVVGDDLEVIASGPTAPDPSTYAQAQDVLERYALPIPPPIQAGLDGEVPETPKPGDPVFERVHNVLVGSNRTAADAALQAAEELGLQARLLTTSLTGEAREAGAWIAGQLKDMPPGSCWIAGGETTVTLGDAPGLGGRNQELALAAVRPLAGREDALLVALATDGVDGPTDAAGAVVSGQTLARGQARGMQPEAFLERHASFTYFDALDDLIRTGPTRTNVNDLAFLFRFFTQ